MASRLLRRLFVAMLVPGGIVVGGLEDTIECRRGDHMRAQGLYRAPVRSSHSPVVNVSGGRGRCCMRLTPMTWAGRVWALPVMTVLYPSERFDAQPGRGHPTLVERAGQRIHVGVRWWPGRDLVCVADSRAAGLELLQQISACPRAHLSTRRRLAAAL